METVAPIEDLAQVATRWQDTMLSLEREYEQEPEVLKIGEVAIGTLGNFSASIGKAKSKKTFNVSAMVHHSRHIESLFAFSLAYRCTEISQCPDSHFAYFQNFRLLFVFPFQAEHCILPSCSDLSKIFNGCYRFHTHQLLGLALRRVVASIRACSSSMLIGDSPFLPLSNHLSNSSR